MTLTKPQRRSLKLKFDQSPDGAKSYREFRRRAVQGYDCIMIQWCGMWIGIEHDGYAHS